MIQYRAEQLHRGKRLFQEYLFRNLREVNPRFKQFGRDVQRPRGGRRIAK